jgi:diacylglycerol kinase family enzyme
MADATIATPTLATPGGPRRIVAVVVNGTAGNLARRADAYAWLGVLFAQAGLETRMIPDGAGDLTERVRLAVASGCAAVVVVGGDGTIACAAQLLQGTDVPLGILPFGTMNVLAKDLHLPISDPAAALAIIASGMTRRIDVGRVNGHVFLCGSVLGLPARLARYREGGRAMPRWRLWLRMARAALREFARYAPLSVALNSGRGFRRLRVSSLIVSPNPIDKPSIHTLGRSRLDGGRLAIYVVSRLKLRDAVRLFVKALIGRWRTDQVVREHIAERLAVVSSRAIVRVMNDGELKLLRTPLQYRIIKRGLRVFAPPVPGEAPTA